MDDFIGFTSCMFIVFITTWTLSNPYVYPESYEYAKKVCEHHQGLKFLDEDKTFSSKAVCNDGVEINYNNQTIGKDK